MKIILLAVLLAAAIHPAALLNHDLRITNAGYKTIKVCRHWDGPPTRRTPCYDGTGYLGEGQNSLIKLGWRDVDGVRVNANYKLMERTIGPDLTVARAHSYTYWVKVQPTLFSHHRRLYLKRVVRLG